MRNQFKRFFSLVLVCVMTLNLAVVNSMAAPSYDNYSSQEVKISGTVYELYVTNNRTGQIDVLRVTKNNDGTCSSQGWLDIENVNTYKSKSPDFQVGVDNGQIFYKESNGVSKALGVINNKSDGKMSEVPSTARITYPTGWYADETKYGSIGTDLANVVAVAAALLTVGGLGAGTSTVITVANYIIANKVPIVYYGKTRYSRALSACEQEYYYEVKWYKNSNYTGLVGTSKGGTEVVNLC